jgi:hypothetical protein
MATDFNNTIRTPHAAVLVWNYVNRLDTGNVKEIDVNKVQPVIISTVSLMSINTSKSKSAPAGQFSLTLAPTKNWVEVLTPGSWLAIMMGTRQIEAKDIETASPDLVKMLGRIDSVRLNVTVDPGSGARQTVYTVQGQDWGQIFDTNLYIDPIVRGSFNGLTAVATAERILYEDIITDFSKTGLLPTSTQNVSALLRLIARPISGITEVQTQTKLLIKPENNFQFPDELVKFFNFLTLQGTKSTAIGNAIEIVSGKLNGKKNNEYEETRESVGIINPDSIFNQHSLWQLLTDNCNHILNELVTDLSWSVGTQGMGPNIPSGVASLTLFKRIKPFVIEDGTPDLDDAKSLISKFTDLKYVEIPLDNVVNMNAGNNWRDKYNFVELQIDKSLTAGNSSAEIKLRSQSFDAKAFGREGFRPMIWQSNQIPQNDKNQLDAMAYTKWKGLLRAWYFNTHNMLNGTISFMGIGDHIRVGDNILVNAKVFGPTFNMNGAEYEHRKTGDAYMLAHVENISHAFLVDPNGSRSYITTVSFVRGIITGPNGKQFTEAIGDGALDNPSKFNDNQDKNSVNVFSTSTEMDPNNKNRTDGT